MSDLFEPNLGWNDNADQQFARWMSQPWYPAAQRMFTEWRDTQSPNVCTLAYMRFLKGCEKAVAALIGREWPRSYVMRHPYLSNGHPVRHYKRRVTLKDFGL
jgi:hypothetical protein